MIDRWLKMVGKIPAKLARWQRGLGGAVINFHHIGTPGPYVQRLDITLSPAEFEERVAFLTSRRRILPFSQFAKAPFERDTVALTFDDGYRSFLTTALPLLEKYRCPVKMYLNSQQVQGHLSWLNKLSFLLDQSNPEDLEQLARAAMPNAKWESPPAVSQYRRWFEFPLTSQIIDATFAGWRGPPSADGLYLNEADVKALAGHPLLEWGSHSEAHLPLEKLPAADQRQAVVACHDYLRGLLGAQLDGFALPFGGAGLRVSALADLVASIDRAFVTATGERIFLNRVGALPEIQRIPGEWSIDRLTGALNSRKTPKGHA